jgi:hypothetical protein
VSCICAGFTTAVGFSNSLALCFFCVAQRYDFSSNALFFLDSMYKLLLRFVSQYL